VAQATGGSALRGLVNRHRLTPWRFFIAHPIGAGHRAGRLAVATFAQGIGKVARISLPSHDGFLRSP
jgi:hypothetical protein